MTIYSLDVLLFRFRNSLFSMSSSNCCFLNCIQISQEAGQVVRYSHLFKNFPQYFVISTVKDFGIVNDTNVVMFLEPSCFFNDPADVDNLISESTAFSKSSLNIWKFMVPVLLKPGLVNFEYYFASTLGCIWVKSPHSSLFYFEDSYNFGVHSCHLLLDHFQYHNDMITLLEPDILQCEVIWALGSITMNKASGGDGIPVELFQILKDDAAKVLHSIYQQIWKISSGHRIGKGQFSFQSQRKAMPKNAQTTAELHSSHTLVK